MAKVKVELFGTCYVGGQIRAKGEIVEVAAEIAGDFGSAVEPEVDQNKPELRIGDTVQSLTARYGKPALLKLAGELHVEVKKDNNKDEIAQRIIDSAAK
jgi:hypothetical protein